MLVGDIGKQWSTRVTCSDASPDGFGRELPIAQVKGNVEIQKVGCLGVGAEREGIRL